MGLNAPDSLMLRYDSSDLRLSSIFNQRETRS
jgi:hypothetical protein